MYFYYISLLSFKDIAKGVSMHARTSAVIISSIYLFTPMVFYSGELVTQSKIFEFTTPESSTLVEALNGMGGPEYSENVFGLDAIINGNKTVVGDVFSPFAQDNTFVETKTQTINYLKVANTTWPVDIPDVSSDYGWRTPPCNGCSADHRGIDFVPGYGTPVYAVTDGMVTNINEGGGGYGVYVVLDHLVANEDGDTDKWQTLYAHMKTGSVPQDLKIGSVVKKGEVIGRVGSTGQSTGPHLHFELSINGENMDPLPLLGTYKILTVIEEEHANGLRLGETFKTRVETVEYR